MRLVFRCDDAGASLGATLAIAECVRRGVGRCVSVMVPGPGFEASVPELRKLVAEAGGEVELGLHIVLNSEWKRHRGSAVEPARWGPVLPASQVPSLVLEDGTFWHTPMDFHQRQASTDEMAAEVEAQLRRGLEAGLALTYADEHMGVGWLPGLREKLRAVVTRYGLKYSEGAPLAGLPGVEGGFETPWARLAAQIRAAPEGDYLYVSHPNRMDEDAHRMMGEDLPPGQVAGERELDRQMLQHPEVLGAIRERGARLICYRDVL